MSISGNKMSDDVDKNIFKVMLAVTVNMSTVGYKTEVFIFFPSAQVLSS